MDIIKNKHSLNVNIIDFNDKSKIGFYPIVVFQSNVQKLNSIEYYLNIESVSLSKKLEYEIYPLDTDNGVLYSGKLDIKQNKNNVICIPCMGLNKFFISVKVEKYFIDMKEITSDMKKLPKEDYYETYDYLYYGIYTLEL